MKIGKAQQHILKRGNLPFTSGEHTRQVVCKGFGGNDTTFAGELQPSRRGDVTVRYRLFNAFFVLYLKNSYFCNLNHPIFL
jgi:hypothetical protein